MPHSSLHNIVTWHTLQPPWFVNHMTRNIAKNGYKHVDWTEQDNGVKPIANRQLNVLLVGDVKSPLSLPKIGNDTKIHISYRESFAMTDKSYPPPLPQLSTAALTLIRDALRVCQASRSQHSAIKLKGLITRILHDQQEPMLNLIM